MVKQHIASKQTKNSKIVTQPLDNSKCTDAFEDELLGISVGHVQQ